MTVSDLPTVNAALNGASAALLLAGYGFIRARRISAHRLCMSAAFAASALFLACYLVYHAQVGSVPFPGRGAWRVAYFAILIPHVALAALVLPFALRTLFLASRKRFAEHARLARRVWPVWMFVSVSGIAVYLMLYRISW